MGVMYYLAREDNRTLFEIGKMSGVSDVFRELGEGRAREQEWLPRYVTAEAELRDLIRPAIDDPANSSVIGDAWAAECARRIVAFAGDQPVCLLNDHSSDDEMRRNYADGDDRRIVDTVYFADAYGDWATSRPA